MQKDYIYTTDRGHRIHITVYGKFGKQPCVLYLHGFKGFKDWGFVPHTGKYFAENGITFVSFNFSHNGVGGAHGTDFNEPEKFGRNTYSLEVEEACEMVRLIVDTDFFGAYLREPLGLLGHSRGGGVAILTAREMPEVQALTTWSAISTVARYDDATVAAWKKKGTHEIKNSRTGQVFHLQRKHLDDIEQHADGELNILHAARELERPWLIVHGAADETVPYYEAETLNIYGAEGLTQLYLVPDTGHTFDAAHPFTASPPALERVLALTASFFGKNLQAREAQD